MAKLTWEDIATKENIEEARRVKEERRSGTKTATSTATNNNQQKQTQTSNTTVNNTKKSTNSTAANNTKKLTWDDIATEENVREAKRITAERRVVNNNAPKTNAPAAATSNSILDNLANLKDRLAAIDERKGELKDILKEDVLLLKNDEEKYNEYLGNSYEDNFVDRFRANYTQGKLGQDSNAAWNDYYANPTEDNRRKAEYIDSVLEQFATNNAETLSGDGWVDKSLAGYLPQFFDQSKTYLGGAAAGATGALALNATGVLAGLPEEIVTVPLGIKAGVVAAGGKYAYDNMRGAAFRELIKAGVDEQTARAAAGDEALVSGLIEMADTGIDIATLGFGKLITNATKFGVKQVAKQAAKEGAEAAAEKSLKKVMAALGKYGANVALEGAQEGVQEVISLANQERALQGNTGKGDLLYSTWDKAFNLSDDEAAQVWDSTKEGMKISSMMSGASMAGTSIANKAIDARNNKIYSQTGQELSDMGVVDDVIQSGLESAPETESHKLAQELQAKREAGVEISNAEVGRLHTENVKAIREEESMAQNKPENEAVAQSFDEGDKLTAEAPTVAEREAQEAVDVVSSDAEINSIKKEPVMVDEIEPSRVEAQVSNNVAQNADTDRILNELARERVEMLQQENEYNFNEAKKTLGEHGAKALENFYDSNTDFDKYYVDFSTYYEAGKIGTPMDLIDNNYSREVAREVKFAAYMAGQNDANVNPVVEKEPVENFVNENYNKLKEVLSSYDVASVDGIKYSMDMKSDGYYIDIQRDDSVLGGRVTNARSKMYADGPFETRQDAIDDILSFAANNFYPEVKEQQKNESVSKPVIDERTLKAAKVIQEKTGMTEEEAVEKASNVWQAIDERNGKTKLNKGSVEDVHEGVLDRESENDGTVRKSEPVPKVEEERNTGAADRELSEDVASENGTDVQATEGETPAEKPADSGSDNNRVRKSDDGDGDSGTGNVGNDNVDDSVKESKAKDYSITKAAAEEIDTKAPSFDDNIKAIETLQAIESSGKAPTKAQQAILAKYKGWGGLSNAFWRERSKLKEIMSDSEIAAAQSTVNDAYYTPTSIIDCVYKALNQLGFEGGNILEPSMGVGNFFGRMPKAIKDNSSLFGVEIDTISGRIAQYLYPSAKIEIAPFQDVAYKDGAFDLIVGNVPFGEVKYKYKGKKYLIHDYFFVKAMDKLNDGGVMALLTSKGTLDKLDSTTRAELNRQGNLIAAYRLPSNVFSKSANANVVTDLIIMQKSSTDNGEKFINLKNVNFVEGRATVNEYFANHPENIIGKVVAIKDWRNGELKVDVRATGDVSEQLTKAIKKLPKNLLNGVQTTGSVDVVENKMPMQTFIAMENGGVEYIDAATGEVKQVKGKSAKVATDYIGLKDVYQDLVDTTLSGGEKTVVDAKRKALNNAYDGFVKKYGTLEANKKLLSADNDFFKISGLEVYDTKTKSIIKSEMFTKDTLGKRKPKRADNTLDALSISIGESGGVDLARISELTNLSENEVLKQLDDRIVYTPDGTYELNEVYLSGNVREKYNAVKGKKGFEKNEKMLKDVVPEDIPAKNITPQFGSPWIQPKYVSQFLKETLHLYSAPTVNYDATTGTWSISGNTWGDNTLITNKYGTKYIDAMKLAEKALNMRKIVVKDKEGVVLVGETRAAQQKADDIKAAFEEWCFKDSERRQDLVTTFNEKFNSHRNMDFSELSKYLTFDGLTDTFKLREYQKRAIARAIFNGNTLLAHGVGTGKTAEMIAIAMELKRMGIAKKNMMVVPPHKVADFRNDILKMYPSAKVIMLEKGANATQRQKFYAQVAANDFDIVIIPHSSFGMLDVSADTKKAFISNQLAELEEVMTQAQLERGNIDGRFIKQLENQKKRLEEKLKAITESAKDNGNTFEELGVDSLFVDEAHNFKNLPFYSKLSRVAGVSVNQSNNKTRASRAENMFMITDYLNRNNGRITFGTATPITNSMSEIYNMIRFLRPDILQEAGIQSFDAWASMFGSIVNQAEVDPSGRHMRMKERFSKFKNVPQMVEQFRRMADILKTGDVIQELPVAERIDVINEPNDIQEEFLDIVDKMIDEIRASGQNAKHNMLEVTTAGQMAAVDLRFVETYFEGEYTTEDLNIPNNRIARVAEKVIKEYTDSNARKGTQFVFCDVGVSDDPSKKYNLHVYGDLINRLVAGGIPRNEIAVAQDFEDKADLSAKVNTGEIRVLIGSTAVMGEGMNAQNKAVALHHMTVPARPSDIEQREGRIIRYGNENKNIRIYRYIQEKSYDSYQWQMQERKAGFINQALSGGTVEELEEMSDFQLTAREAKAIASGNPLLLEKIEVEDKLAKLKSLRNKFNTDKLEMKDRLAMLPNRINKLEKTIANTKADISTIEANKTKDFEITFGKTKYTERAKAAEALGKLVSKAPRNGSNVLVGSYRGLDLYYSASLEKGVRYILKGNKDYIVEGGESALGNITRIINAVDKIPSSLETDEAILKNYNSEIETLKKEVEAEFPKAKELEELQAKLNEIDTALGINVSEVDMSEVVVGEEDDDGEVMYSKDVGEQVQHPERWTTTRVGDENKTPMRLSDIVNKIRKDFGINITIGHVRGKDIKGLYNRNNRGIRSKIANDLPTIAHELGHHLDNTYGITGSLDAGLLAELENGLDDAMKDKYPEKKWKKEGYAEFVRKYLQNRETAAIDYPKFTAHFLNSMDGKDAALITQLADEVNAYYSLDADTATSSIRLREEAGKDTRTVKEKLKEKSSVFYQAWVDANHGIKMFDEATGSNAYTLANNAAYSDAVAGQIIVGDLTDTNGQYVSSGLKAALHGINLNDEKEYRLFGEYLVVKHGPECLAEGLRIFADDRKNSTAFMERRMAELEEQYPEFKNASDRLYKFINDFYGVWAVKTGLISQETLNSWRDRWEYYVPLNRDVGEKGLIGAKRGFANQNSTIKKMRGSGLDFIHPVDNLINNIVKVVNAGTRNNVMRAITNSADAMGADALFLEKVPMPMKVTKMDMTGVKADLSEKIKNSNMKAQDQVIADEIVEGIDDILLQYGRGKAYGDVITVLKNGTPEYWKINDPLLLSSVTTMSPKVMEGVLDAYAVVSRFMTANITGNNIIWSLFSNFPRDIMTLFTYSKNKNPIKLFGAMGSTYINKVNESLGKEIDPLYREYLAMGGGQTSAYTADRDLAKRARKKFAGKKISANPLDWVAYASNLIEAGPRFATYKLLRQSGIEPHEAFYGAMDITVNFRRGGRVSRELNKAIPFFNVSIQGLDKFRRWITAEDVSKLERSKVIRSRTVSYIAVSAALAAMVYALNNGDEEDEKNYEQLSNYTKNNFWNIPLGDGKYFAIPKPRELGVLSSFFETSMEYGAGENEHAFDEFYDYATDNLLPAVASDIAKVGQKGAIETGMAAIGNLGIIGVAGYLGANRDFLGNPIVSSGLQNLEPKDQYTNRTSKIAYNLGQAFNTSPVQIDYFFQQVLGGWWKYQKALFPVGGENVDYTLGVRNSYIKDNQYSNDIVDWIYDKADASAKAKNSDTSNVEKAIAAKLDSNMTSFYSRYYKLAKDKAETELRRGTRQTVLDMLFEYRKIDDNGTFPEMQEAVNDVCRDMGKTDYLPSVMNTEVKDGNGIKHTLSDTQYVEYQTDYLRIYWETVEDTFSYSMSKKEKAEILTAAKKVAQEQATSRVLSRIGAATSEYQQEYGGISNKDMTTYFARVAEAGDDGKTTQDEVVNVILDLGLDDGGSYQLFTSRYSRASAKEAQEYGIPADLYLNAIMEMKKITGKNRRQEIESYLNSVCNNYREWLFLLGTEYDSVKKDDDYIMYFGEQ